MSYHYGNRAKPPQRNSNSQRFAWWEGTPLWHMVVANMWEHYQEHRESIEKWIKESE